MHTPSIAFRHLPPNSARTSYATEGTLFISAQLYPPTLSAPSERFGYKTVQATLAHPPRVKKKEGSVSIQAILVLFVLALATWA